MYVRDLEGNEYAVMCTYTIEDELNGNTSLSAVLEPNKPNLEFLDDITEMWELVDDSGAEYKIIYVQKQGQGDMLNAQIRAIPLFFDDFTRERVYEEYNESMTASRAFNAIFKDSGYFHELRGDFKSQEWESFGGGESRLEMFKRALNRYKAEFEIEGNTIYIDNLVGRDTDIMYRHRLNASNIMKEIDASELYTYARGYGDYEESESGGWENAKLEREYTSPLAKIMGIRHAPPIKDGRITTKDTLDEQLKELVDESLKISVTAGVHDLTRQGYPIAQAKNGDRVFLIDERIGLQEEVRVVNRQITRDWRGRILDISLTFGSQTIVKRHQSNLNNAISSVNDILNGKAKIPFSVLDNAVIEATQALKDAETELSFSKNGILAVDKHDPNNVVLLNSAGLGVSTDGGETFRNAITGKGINADTIVTGSMLADRIAGGVLESLNGRTVFNLNDGHLEMRDTNFVLGGGANFEFTSSGNKIQYERNRRKAGLGVGTALGNQYPIVYLGAGGLDQDVSATDEARFSGFIANTRQRRSEDGVGNSVIGLRFDMRNNAVNYNKGLTLELSGNFPVFRPFNGHEYNYSLGEENNKFDKSFIRTMNGTLEGTSAHNAKMNLEDIDGQSAYDYFMQMKIKSFYYKDDDYTNPYNKKVSPVIEQLDPVLEKLYKSNDDALDLNSNLFLLARAFQYFVEKQQQEIKELKEMIG